MTFGGKQSVAAVAALSLPVLAGCLKINKNVFNKAQS